MAETKAQSWRKRMGYLPGKQVGKGAFWEDGKNVCVRGRDHKQPMDVACVCVCVPVCVCVCVLRQRKIKQKRESP